MPDDINTKELGDQETKRPVTQKRRKLPERLRFVIRETGGVLEVPATHSIIVGRKTNTQFVDVDLTDFQAVELGVSRQHVEIMPRTDEQLLIIKDLDAVNGSFINKQPMVPGQLYELEDGDVLKLGLMHVTVEFVD
ncbi:MAG: FHA domain-containing protein [Anaerolineae bacterium]|nr:FHA domain-containing protein [Anaerolineae bacterium]